MPPPRHTAGPRRTTRRVAGHRRRRARSRSVALLVCWLVALTSTAVTLAASSTGSPARPPSGRAGGSWTWHPGRHLPTHRPRLPHPTGSVPGPTATDGSPTPTVTPTTDPTDPTTDPTDPTDPTTDPTDDPTDDPTGDPPTVDPDPATTCAQVPGECGYPDAASAGVPAGLALRSVPAEVSSGPGWDWDERGWVSVHGDGAVFSGFRVEANVDVTGHDVVISNNLLVQAGDGFGVSLRHTRNALVAHNTITSPSAGDDRLLVGVKDIYGDDTGTRVVGNDISHVATGVQIESGVIADNYIHDMGYRDGDHTNGTTSNAGGPLLVIRHNTILNQIDQTDAVSLFEDFGAQHDRTVVGNLLAGGGYTIYGGANPGGEPTARILIVGNRISRLFFPRGGYFGPVTAFDPDGPGNLFAGNVWDDTGTPGDP